MLSAIIIDDEAAARNVLNKMIKTYTPQVQVVAQGDSVNEAKKLIEIHKPDVVFLDIDMPGKDGFKLLDEVQEIDFDVIFVTAYDQYALKAFRYAAVDFLLKPVNPEELEDSVKRISSKENSESKTQQFDLLKKDLLNNVFEQIVIPTNDGLIFIKLAEIYRLEADRNYTLFFLAGGKKLLSTKSLKEYEQLLSDQSFFRTHKSHMVHLKFITKYVRSEGGHVIMIDETMVPVSRRRKELFIDLLNKYK